MTGPAPVGSFPQQSSPASAGLPPHAASEASADPIPQTASGGRSVAELVAEYEDKISRMSVDFTTRYDEEVTAHQDELHNLQSAVIHAFA